MTESIEVVDKRIDLIIDATLLTSVMTCGLFTDMRQNKSFVQNTGKSNSLECGSIVHKYLEVYYGSIIHGLSKAAAHQMGMAAAEMYIKGCQFCSEFEPYDCTFCVGLGNINKSTDEMINCPECLGKGKITKPLCGHPPNEYPGVKNTPVDNQTKPERIGWSWVLKTCEQYSEFYKNDYWVPLEVEVVKRKILFEDDNIRIMWKAKLDWTGDTNQGIYPMDHKTMKQRRDTLSLNNQFIGQCHVMGTQGVIINKIGFQSTLKPEEKFTRPMMNYSTDRLIEWQSEILPYWAYQLIQYDETGYWPPNFTNCENKFGKCVFSNVCEADRGMREEVIKMNFIVGPKWDVQNLEND